MNTEAELRLAAERRAFLKRVAHIKGPTTPMAPTMEAEALERISRVQEVPDMETASMLFALFEMGSVKVRLAVVEVLFNAAIDELAEDAPVERGV